MGEGTPAQQAQAGNEHGNPVVYIGADGGEQLGFLDNDERLWPILACVGDMR